ncbi:MAG: hypothetical protein ACREMM_07575 [Gemmatimonadales bacterium]
MKSITGRIDPAWVQRQLHEIRSVQDQVEVRVREKALWLLRQLFARHLEAAKAAEAGDLVAYERIVRAALGLVGDIRKLEEG